MVKIVILLIGLIFVVPICLYFLNEIFVGVAVLAIVSAIFKWKRIEMLISDSILILFWLIGVYIIVEEFIKSYR